ncbi:hypothetical protein IJT10_02880, partial [bacterium]|nr:hypothetical protein [bacterium]
AEAEFVLRNGIRIKQDLTGSSRLVWKSSNRSVLISQGNGTFRAVSPGSVKILACLGNKESEIDVIVNPVTVKTTNTETVPSGDTGNNISDLDPTLNTDPTPVVSQSSLCNLKIDLQDNVPEELNCEIRTYDENNQLRFIEKDVTDLSSLEIDRNSAVIAGVYTKANGELYGYFEEKLKDLGDSCQITPKIISGLDLTARSELVVSSRDVVCNLNETDPVYSEESQDINGKVTRSVKVYCETSVITDIIKGVWSYQTPASFLQELCTFDADGTEIGRGVFRFFDVGEHTITVSYKGLSANFRVVVTDGAPVSPTQLNLNLDSILTNGRYCQLRGYNSQGLVWQSEGNITRSSTITQSDDNNIDAVTKLVGVIFDSNGEPWGMFENNVSINKNDVNNYTPTSLLTGESFAKQKGAFSSFTMSKTSVDLTNSNSSYVYTYPYFKYTIGNGWQLSYSYSQLASWSDFSLITAPTLEVSSSCKSNLNVYKKDVGTHTIQASYRGVKSSVLSLEVIDNYVAPYSVKLNLSNLPSGTSSIKTQLYKDGSALGSENSHTSGSSFTYNNTSKDANYIVIMVKNASGRLIGVGGGSVTYNSDNGANVNVSIASGSSMNSYIESLTVSPIRKKLAVNSTINGQANATLTFNSGKIKKSIDASSDVSWSSSDMTQVNSSNLWRVNKAGKSSLQATLGTKSGNIDIYASGTSGDVKYGYSEMNVNGKTIVVDVPATETTGSELILTYNGNNKLNGVYPVYHYQNGSIDADIYGKPNTSNTSNNTSFNKSIYDTFDSSVSFNGESKKICGLSLEGTHKPFVLKSSKGSKIENLKDHKLNSIDAEKNTELTPGQQYKNCRPGQVIYNLRATNYAKNRETYNFDAKVLIGDTGNDSGVSNRLIILSALKNDGTPVITTEQAKKIDRLVGISNDFDPDKLSVLDRDRSVFGSEAGFGKNIVMSEQCQSEGLSSNGFDGTDKLIILIVEPSKMDCGDGKYVGGYYTTSNIRPRSFSSNSNEGEVIIINPVEILNSGNYGDVVGTIAHEMQHLLQAHRFIVQDFDLFMALYNGEIDQDTFDTLYDYRNDCYDMSKNFNEGGSALAERLVGCGPISKSVGGSSYSNSNCCYKSSKFIENISKVNFKDGFNYSENVLKDIGTWPTYGKVMVFMNYLYDKYGVDVVKEYLRLSVEAVNQADFGYEAYTVLDESDEYCGESLCYPNHDKCYDLMAQAVSNIAKKQLNFAQLYQDFGLCLLLSSVDSSGNKLYKNVPSTYQLETIIPGSENENSISPITLKKITGAYSASNLVPWSLNFYEIDSSSNNTIFGFWTGLDSIFNFIWFSNDGSNWQYSGLE